MIHILALARAGLSDGFLFPRYAENFGALFQREASLYDFDAALADCVVADYRIADISGLLERAREAARTGFSHELIIKLYLLLKLDKVLRTYVG